MMVATALGLALAAQARTVAQAQADPPRAAKRSTAAPKAAPQRPTGLKKDKTALVSFVTAPFPFEGTVPTTGKPFLDVTDGEKRGHRGMRGQVYWANETYDDSRVLLHLPKGFNPRRPGLLIVYFHGHGATLERDVLKRQQVAAQVTQSGINAVLVAPQFALDAADSSAGKFWEPGTFVWFLEEAAQQLAALYGDAKSVRAFARMPVVFVAYSGGYLPAAYALQGGGAAQRLRAVLLLDALYGDIDKFSSWLTRDRSVIFVSAHTPLTAENNLGLQKVLTQREIDFDLELRKPLRPGAVVFLPTGPEIPASRFRHRRLDHAARSATS